MRGIAESSYIGSRNLLRLWQTVHVHLTQYAEAFGAAFKAADAKVCSAQLQVHGDLRSVNISFRKLTDMTGKDRFKLLFFRYPRLPTYRFTLAVI